MLITKSKSEEIDLDLEIKQIFEAVASPQAEQSVSSVTGCNAFINKRIEEVV